MKVVIIIFSLMSCLAFANDISYTTEPPISLQLNSNCNTAECNVTLCMENDQENDLTISSPFLGEDQLLVNGMLFYPLEDYIQANSDIYSPWLKRGEMTDFFKENYLKRLEKSVAVSFEPREKKCFILDLEKSYILEENQYYIGYYMLQDSFTPENDNSYFLPNSSNIIVIKKPPSN